MGPVVDGGVVRDEHEPYADDRPSSCAHARAGALSACLLCLALYSEVGEDVLVECKWDFG